MTLDINQFSSGKMKKETLGLNHRAAVGIKWTKPGKTATLKVVCLRVTFNLMLNVFISYIVYTLFLNKSAF